MVEEKENNSENLQQGDPPGEENSIIQEDKFIEATDGENIENLSGEKDECIEKDQIIRDWKNEYDELYDKYIRLYSEFENFRRRTNKEKFELMDHANSNLILDILPVVDDFDRAIQHMDNTSEIVGIVDGMKLIYIKFKKILEDRGLREIEAIGKDFNPDLHEAITKIPAPKRKLKDKIVDQIQKGYYLKDKVLRHSKVVVGE
jgi:molecular chaperone GrpE